MQSTTMAAWNQLYRGVNRVSSFLERPSIYRNRMEVWLQRTTSYIRTASFYKFRIDFVFRMIIVSSYFRLCEIYLSWQPLHPTGALKHSSLQIAAQRLSRYWGTISILFSTRRKTILYSVTFGSSMYWQLYTRTLAWLMMCLAKKYGHHL